MNIDYKNYFGDNVRNLLYLIIILVVIIILLYASNQTSMQKNNCAKIIKTFPKYTITPMGTTYDDTLITKFFIKTAYNCCCSGKFKNDYVDLCALQNCANYGVRALDFQIFKLNGKPIISASTVNEITYKEIYNYLDFNETMLNVYKYFIQNAPITGNNVTEPLFLIFRVYSKSKDTYDQMFTSLNNIFGGGRIIGNMIYLTNDLLNATFSQLKNKVVIIVEYSCINTTYTLDCQTAFNSSSLYNITSLNLNGSTSKIYRESELLHNTLTEYTTWTNNLDGQLNIVYPNIQTNSYNYDFILSGFDNGISFIGLNFQTNDTQLALLNTEDVKDSNGIVTTVKGFGSYAFKLKPAINIDDSSLMDGYIQEFKDNVVEGNDIIVKMLNGVKI
jgi:hypothetical protein